MQGKGISLRLGLLALVVVLVLSAVGSLSLARDAFDGNDYEDCPAATRLDAVSGLAVDRTDKEDEIRISWDALSSTVLDKLGVNLVHAGFTVIVEGGVEDLEDGGPLGTTSLVVKGIEYTKDLTVSVAITLDEFVISDIAEKDFTSGMPGPTFSSGVKVAGTTVDDALTGDPDGSVFTGGWAADEDIIQKFYYLGFNDVFDNWFVESHTVASPGTLRTSPRTAKFRVGLGHGDGDATPADADFDHYRIVIEDSSGDLLGYQARTVSAGNTYGSNKIVFGAGDAFLTVSNLTDTDEEYTGITNIRLAGDVTGDSAMSPYYAADFAAPEFDEPDGSLRLSYGNVDVNALQTVADDGVVNAFFLAGVLFVDPPVEYFDFPSDVFEGDGNYTIKAWAEDDDGTRISPVKSIVLSVREGDPVESTFNGYEVTVVADGPDTVAPVRSWGTADVARLSVYGLSIQVED